jgi:hypothetical protein
VSGQDGSLAPTAKLRWLARVVPAEVLMPGQKIYASEHTVTILQQWWAPNVPAFMADDRIGEWRDVVVVESP